jgi:hypothetical protein
MSCWRVILGAVLHIKRVRTVVTIVRMRMLWMRVILGRGGVSPINQMHLIPCLRVTVGLAESLAGAWRDRRGMVRTSLLT